LIETGIDILSRDSCKRLQGKRVGLLANPASVTRELEHASEVIHRCGLDLVCLFGPQHGYTGETQANMIEWESYTHPSLGIPVYSLYGSSREPEESMLRDLDIIIIDLPDIGARPYTYLWTALLMIRSCAAAGIAVLVLDRPNVIGGELVEGSILDSEYLSFVGLHPLPMRHGLTIGEALSMINRLENIGCDLELVKINGWKRSLVFDDTGLPWVLPSPNIPTPGTALVYPGMVLLEGTNISEGRGTTKPFELIGAPWIDGKSLADALNDSGLHGFVARSHDFEPAWDKYAGERCGGVQIHVTDSAAFRPVRFGATVIALAASRYGDRFSWLEPPYEYEYEKMPIDILSGNASLRGIVDAGDDLSDLFEQWEQDESKFREARREFLLY
jgi:uncharacterized protein YbbC (DUF1343 family)